MLLITIVGSCAVKASMQLCLLLLLLLLQCFVCALSKSTRRDILNIALDNAPTHTLVAHVPRVSPLPFMSRDLSIPEVARSACGDFHPSIHSFLHSSLLLSQLFLHSLPLSKNNVDCCHHDSDAPAPRSATHTQHNAALCIRPDSNAPPPPPRTNRRCCNGCSTDSRRWLCLDQTIVYVTDSKNMDAYSCIHFLLYMGHAVEPLAPLADGLSGHRRSALLATG